MTIFLPATLYPDRQSLSLIYSAGLFKTKNIISEGCKPKSVYSLYDREKPSDLGTRNATKATS